MTSAISASPGASLRSSRRTHSTPAKPAPTTRILGGATVCVPSRACVVLRSPAPYTGRCTPHPHRMHPGPPPGGGERAAARWTAAPGEHPGPAQSRARVACPEQRGPAGVRVCEHGRPRCGRSRRAASRRAWRARWRRTPRPGRPAISPVVAPAAAARSATARARPSRLTRHRTGSLARSGCRRRARLVEQRVPEHGRQPRIGEGDRFAPVEVRGDEREPRLFRCRSRSSACRGKATSRTGGRQRSMGRDRRACRRSRRPGAPGTAPPLRLDPGLHLLLVRGDHRVVVGAQDARELRAAACPASCPAHAGAPTVRSRMASSPAPAAEGWPGSTPGPRPGRPPRRRASGSPGRRGPGIQRQQHPAQGAFQPLLPQLPPRLAEPAGVRHRPLRDWRRCRLTAISRPDRRGGDPGPREVRVGEIGCGACRHPPPARLLHSGATALAGHGRPGDRRSRGINR